MNLFNWGKKDNTELLELKARVQQLQDTQVNNAYNNIVLQFANDLTPIYAGDNRVKYMDQGYRGNEDVYSIVSKIATKAAMCPAILYEVKKDSDLKRYKSMKGGTTKEAQFMASVYRTKALQEVERHSVLDVLENPNPHQNSFECKMAAMVFMLINGNSYMYGIDGLYKGLWRNIFLLPAQFTSIVSGGKFEPVKGYTVDWATEKLPFEAREVHHMKYPGFNFDQNGSHLYGQSPLEVAINNTLKRNNSASKQQTKQMDNAGMLGMIVNEQEKFELTPTQREALENKLTNRMKSDKEFQRWMVANGSLKWLQMGFSSKELEILPSLGWDQKKLCNIYGYPIQLLNSEAASTDNNMKWASKNFINNTVAPLLNQFDDALNRFLITPYSKKDGKQYYIEHDITAYPEMQEDMKEMVDWLEKAWWIKGKDKQAVMKFTQDEKDPMMNTYLIPSNLLPAEELAVTDKDFDNANETNEDY